MLPTNNPTAARLLELHAILPELEAAFVEEASEAVASYAEACEWPAPGKPYHVSGLETMGDGGTGYSTEAVAKGIVELRAMLPELAALAEEFDWLRERLDVYEKWKRGIEDSGDSYGWAKVLTLEMQVKTWKKAALVFYTLRKSRIRMDLDYRTRQVEYYTTLVREARKLQEEIDSWSAGRAGAKQCRSLQEIDFDRQEVCRKLALLVE